MTTPDVATTVRIEVVNPQSLDEVPALVAESRDNIHVVRLLTADDVSAFLDRIPQSMLAPAGIAGGDEGVALNREVRNALLLNENEQPLLFESVRRTIEERLQPIILTRAREERFRISPMNLVRYEAGGFMRPHHDAGPGQYVHRLFTVAVYLSADFEGGCTRFPHLDLEVRPTVGSAVLFPSPYVHEAQRVVSGEKKILQFFLCDMTTNPDLL
jgi:prolyl 4-hydroxylase